MCIVCSFFPNHFITILSSTFSMFQALAMKHSPDRLSASISLPLTVNPWLVCHCCCLILIFARDNLTNSPTTNFSTHQLGCHIVFEAADVLTVLVCLIISSKNLPLIGHTMTFKLINSTLCYYYDCVHRLSRFRTYYVSLWKIVEHWTQFCFFRLSCTR